MVHSVRAVVRHGIVKHDIQIILQTQTCVSVQCACLQAMAAEQHC